MTFALIALLVYSICFGGVSANDTSKNTVSHKDVEVSLGHRAMLPCDLTLPAPDDAIYLVLWFIEPQKKPIFTFDARGKPLLSGRRWSETGFLGPRADFRLSFQGQEGQGYLTLENVTLEDEGSYRCRVDFKNSPARHNRVRLNVTVPPSSVEITDSLGQSVKSPMVGPLLEESHLVLHCRVTGGKPVPQVVWWLNDQRLPSVPVGENLLSGESGAGNHVPILVEELRLGPLKRSHLAAQITCTASNSHNEMPRRKTLTLDMHLVPLKVEILRQDLKLNVGEKTEIRCNAAGSRPAASITWWKDNQKLPDSYHTVKETTNTTVSILTLTPQLEDHGKYLTCRARNPTIDGSALEDFLRMDVQYAPRVSLRLGPTLNASVIKEGDDVYFECSISANPDPAKLIWRHQGKLVVHNASAGVIMSNQSLVLRGVTQRNNGNYTCTGINTRGEGVSNPVTLTVRYIPLCRQGFQHVAGIERSDIVNLSCSVDSVPRSYRYRWAFNTTRGWKDIVSDSSADLRASVSFARKGEFLQFRPEAEGDFGHIGCWAANDVGWQREPCIFHITPAGPPEAPSNCSLLNQTAESLFINCDTSSDGGLKTRFHLQALDAETRFTLISLYTETAQFWLFDLEPGSTFLLYIYAVNSKGSSPPTILPVSTLKEAAKRTVPPATDNFFPGNVLAIVAGVVSTVVLVVCTVVVVAVIRYRVHTRQLGEQQPVAESSPDQQLGGTTVVLNGKNVLEDEDDEAQFYHQPVRNSSPVRWPQKTSAKLNNWDYVSSADVPESCV